MDGVPAGAQKSRTYYVHPTHGPRRLPMRWETFGPVLTTPNPAAVRAREWLREFKYWQDIAEMDVPRSAFKAFLKELVRG
jgi:hypothetical protein